MPHLVEQQGGQRRRRGPARRRQRPGAGAHAGPAIAPGAVTVGGVTVAVSAQQRCGDDGTGEAPQRDDGEVVEARSHCP